MFDAGGEVRAAGQRGSGHKRGMLQGVHAWLLMATRQELAAGGSRFKCHDIPGTHHANV